jgi:hypothetical protein
MPKSSTLEIKGESGWVPVDVADALARDERQGRCVECGQPVRPHAGSKNGKQAAHVEHLKRNSKCSRSDHRC